MSLFDMGRNIQEFNKALLLSEERYKAQVATDDGIKKSIAVLQDKLAELTTRVAVLEEARSSIDDRVERKMTEVIARWQHQHDMQELQRAQDELAELKKKQVTP